MKQRLLNPYTFLDGLKKAGQKFNVKKTLYTMEIECDYGEFKWVSKESNVPLKELFFIKMVKNDVKQFNPYDIGIVNESEIKYYKLPTENFELEDCHEIDISSAYWEFSKIFLTDKVWKRGLTVDKKTRLAALGGLAKTTIEQTWNGKEFINHPVEISETRNLFFYCAKETGEIIESARSVCDSFIFSWVDALFVRNEKDLNYIKAVLEIKGLKAKTYKCEKIISTDNKITVWSDEHFKSHPKRKRNERDFFKERISSNFFIGRFKDKLLQA